jgi:hypothetical protein
MTSVARLIPSIKDSRHPSIGKQTSQGRNTKVVELGFGDRVVDIDGRDLQCTLLQHSVKIMDSSGGFLGDSLDSVEELRELLVDESGKITTCDKHLHPI